MLKKRILICIAVCFSTLTVNVQAGGGLNGGATELTQLLNRYQLALQYITQLKQTEAQLQNLIKSTQISLENPQAYLSTLAGIVEKNQALGLSSARVTQKLEAAYGSDFDAHAPYNGRDYADWMKTTKDSIRGAVRATGVQQDALASEGEQIMQLIQLSDSADGNLKVQQVGNQIALMQLQQAQKLRQMNMAQAQAMNARALAVQNKEENSADVMKRLFGSNKTATPAEARKQLRSSQ